MDYESLLPPTVQKRSQNSEVFIIYTAAHHQGALMFRYSQYYNFSSIFVAL